MNINNFLLTYEKDDEKINIKLFCDECYTKEWIYIGILIVKENEENDLFKDILNSRCGSKKIEKNWLNCKEIETCKYHEKNNREVHFSNLGKDKDLYHIAKRWMDYILCGNNKIRFYILGLDRTKLDLSKFGNCETNIYNRFFRTAIISPIKYFFGKNSKININSIYHDESTNLETHKYFPWHSLYKIEQNTDNIYIKTNKIKFINSNHKYSNNNYSHFIQLIDLILGCFKETFEAESTSKDKIKIATEYVPLIERMINAPNNKNSRYNYFKRYDFSFFPKETIDDLEKIYMDKKKVSLIIFIKIEK